VLTVEVACTSKATDVDPESEHYPQLRVWVDTSEVACAVSAVRISFLCTRMTNAR